MSTLLSKWVKLSLRWPNLATRWVSGSTLEATWSNLGPTWSQLGANLGGWGVPSCEQAAGKTRWGGKGRGKPFPVLGD